MLSNEQASMLIRIVIKKVGNRMKRFDLYLLVLGVLMLIDKYNRIRTTNYLI